MLTDTNITSTASVLRALLSAKYRSRHARKLKIRCSSPWCMAYAKGASSRLLWNGSLKSSLSYLGTETVRARLDSHLRTEGS